MKKQIKVIFMLCVMVLAHWNVWAQSVSVDKIVAVVNNIIIAQSDVNIVLAAVEAEYTALYSDPKELANELRKVKENIVNQMVEEKLVLSEAQKYEIKVSEETIANRIDALKERFPTEELFEEVLLSQGVTLKELQNRFYNQEIMKKAVDYFVRSKIEIDPLEIKQFYQKRKKELLTSEQVRVSTILIQFTKPVDESKALKTAGEVLKRLKSGEEFENLVKLYSQGANIAEGGNLGVITKGDLIEEIDEAIFNLEEGGVTGVIKTEHGYRIFKVYEKLPARQLEFFEAQDVINNILYAEKFARGFKEWIRKLKGDAHIVIK